MFNFNDALAEYLELYGQMIRERGVDIEFRGIQYQLNVLARIVKDQDAIGLGLELDDLKQWAEEL